MGRKKISITPISDDRNKQVIICSQYNLLIISLLWEIPYNVLVKYYHACIMDVYKYSSRIPY